MSSAKIAVSLDKKLLHKVDVFVEKKIFKNRSHAIQLSLLKNVERIEHRRLIEECGHLDIIAERKMADDGFVGDVEWPI